MSRTVTKTVTIADGETTSDAFTLGRFIHGQAAEIRTPGTLAGSSLSFQKQDDADSDTWKPIVDRFGNAFAVTIAADKNIVLDPSEVFFLDGVLRIVSNASESGGTDFTFVLKRI